VAVYDGQVYQHGAKQRGMASDTQARNERTLGTNLKLLGPLAGAHTEVGGDKDGHRRSGNARVADAALATAVVGPLGLLARASRTGYRGFAAVAFADGSGWDTSFTGSASLVKAQSATVDSTAWQPRRDRLMLPRKAGLPPSWSALPPRRPRACWTMRNSSSQGADHPRRIANRKGASTGDRTTRPP